MPDHFLHVSVGEADDLEVGEAKRAWRDVEPFELAYRRANCFHEAAILEVHGEGVGRSWSTRFRSSKILPCSSRISASAT